MPDSNSKAFARRLREAVENREPLEADELRAAAAADETAAALYERQAVVETALDALRARPVDADLADGVLARMHDDVNDAPTVGAEGRSLGKRRTAIAALLVAAAALVVAVLATWGPNRGPEPGAPTSPDLAVTPDEPPVDPDVDDPAPELVADGTELDRLFQEATTAYRGLASETRVAVADLGLLAPPTATRGESTPEVVPDPPTMDDPSGSWLDLAPVRDNVGRTLDYLLEPVPDSMAT